MTSLVTIKYKPRYQLNNPCHLKHAQNQIQEKLCVRNFTRKIIEILFLNTFQGEFYKIILKAKLQMHNVPPNQRKQKFSA